MKFIVFLKAAPASGRAGLAGWLAETGAPTLAAHADRCVLNLVAGAADARFDAAVELWAADAEVLAALNARAWTAVADSVAYAVDEHIEKADFTPPAAGRTAAVKLVAGWTRRVDVSPAEARRHWDEHVPLANRIHVGCERYVRHWVRGVAQAHARDVPCYQGIAFQYYRTAEDLRERSFDRPESVAIIHDDVADFLTNTDVLIVEETVLPRRA